MANQLITPLWTLKRVGRLAINNLKFANNVDRSYNDEFVQAGAKVGVCTSGSPGPTVGKNIGLGYLPKTMSEVGSEFLVDCRGRTVEAVVVKTPFYTRERKGAP